MKQHSEEEDSSRRRFLKYAIGAIAGLISVAVAAPLIRYFIAPGLAEEKVTWVAIARTSDIPIGKPTFVEYEERTQDAWVITPGGKTAWVLTRDGQTYTVYDPHCTHLGCAYFWNEKDNKFLCPCHDGFFDIDGNVVSGPPPRPLDRLQNRIKDGVILVGEVYRVSK